MKTKTKSKVPAALNDLVFDGLTTWVELCFDAAATYINSYLDQNADSESVKVDYDHLRQCIDDVADGIKTVGPVFIVSNITDIEYDGASIKKIHHDTGAHRLDGAARQSYKFCYDPHTVKMDAEVLDALGAKLKYSLARVIELIREEYTDTNAEELYLAITEVLNVMFVINRLYSEAFCLYIQFPDAECKDAKSLTCTVTIGE